MKIAKPINETERLKELYMNRQILVQKIIRVKVTVKAA